MPIRPVAVFLLVFLIWRGSNAVWVLATDRSHVSSLVARGTSLEDRLRRPLLLPSPGVADDFGYTQLALLLRHVPESGKVYYLLDFSRSTDLNDLRRFIRLRWLIFPRYLQPINAMPLPPSAQELLLRDKPTFVLDVGKRPRLAAGAGFVRVDGAAGVVLWRQEESR